MIKVYKISFNSNLSESGVFPAAAAASEIAVVSTHAAVVPESIYYGFTNVIMPLLFKKIIKNSMI